MEGVFKNMKTITDQLIELDPTLKRSNEGHWLEPYHPGPGYTSFNDAGIECETGEFLYYMIRLLKPTNVLETGTHWGIGASYMGMALKDNHTPNNMRAPLDTIEFLPEIHKIAQDRMERLDLHGYVTCHLMDAAKFTPSEQYGLILLDTEPQTRFAEMVKFWDSLAPGGYLFIHDLHRHMHQIPNEEHGFAWPYGMIPLEMKKLVTSGQARPFHFSTPRGLTGFYKVNPEDYKW